MEHFGASEPPLRRFSYCHVLHRFLPQINIICICHISETFCSKSGAGDIILCCNAFWNDRWYNSLCWKCFFMLPLKVFLETTSCRSEVAGWEEKNSHPSKKFWKKSFLGTHHFYTCFILFLTSKEILGENSSGKSSPQ